MVDKNDEIMADRFCGPGWEIEAQNRLMEAWRNDHYRRANTAIYDSDSDEESDSDSERNRLVDSHTDTSNDETIDGGAAAEDSVDGPRVEQTSGPLAKDTPVINHTITGKSEKRAPQGAGGNILPAKVKVVVIWVLMMSVLMVAMLAGLDNMRLTAEAEAGTCFVANATMPHKNYFQGPAMMGWPLDLKLEQIPGGDGIRTSVDRVRAQVNKDKEVSKKSAWDVLSYASPELDMAVREEMDGRAREGRLDRWIRSLEWAGLEVPPRLRQLWTGSRTLDNLVNATLNSSLPNLVYCVDAAMQDLEAGLEAGNKAIHAILVGFVGASLNAAKSRQEREAISTLQSYLGRVLEQLDQDRQLMVRYRAEWKSNTIEGAAHVLEPPLNKTLLLALWESRESMEPGAEPGRDERKWIKRYMLRFQTVQVRPNLDDASGHLDP